MVRSLLLCNCCYKENERSKNKCSIVEVKHYLTPRNCNDLRSSAITVSCYLCIGLSNEKNIGCLIVLLHNGIRPMAIFQILETWHFNEYSLKRLILQNECIWPSAMDLRPHHSFTNLLYSRLSDSSHLTVVTHYLMLTDTTLSFLDQLRPCNHNKSVTFGSTL